MSNPLKYFLPYQRKWIIDSSPLKIIQKSRQVGMSYADAYRSVRLVSAEGRRYDIYVSSRDRFQAKLYVEDCKHWANVLKQMFQDMGEILLGPDQSASAFVLQFSNGRRIYSLSSSPNALAGKRGDVVIDEFALHQDQRMLYRIAKPVTTWGGTVSIISTHRGVGTVFNQIITDIQHNKNPMGWSLHTVSIQAAVAQGLVGRINKKTGRKESTDEFLARLRAECIDEEQWLQEYCCIPADESAAFLSYELLAACEESHLALMTFQQLTTHLANNSQLYLGLDVARRQNLAVIYVSEKIGDVLWDRMRIELHNRPFAELEFELYRLLALPQLKRACIDATGMGTQLAERAKERFGWKVEPVNFTPAVKEDLAFALRAAFEEIKLRTVRDDKLRADLRGLKKEVTSAGNIRFVGETEDSHCDRTWALALCLHGARRRFSAGGMVC